MNRSLVLLPLILLATAHCGSSDGAGSSARPDAGTSLEDGGAAPGSDVDGGPLVVGPADDGGLGVDGCAAAGDGGNVDPPDPEGLDTNCDGADGVVGRDVYVATTGADTNPGTPSAPLQTLSAALTLAATTGGNVLVLNGTYPVTSFSQGGTWAIFGGYPSGFVGQPNRQTTVFTAPDTGLLVSGATSATLAHLTVEGDMPSALTQPTAYALRNEASKLTLLDVVLQAGDGLPMNPGADGAPGADGVASSGPLVCNGVQQPAYANGAFNGEQAIEGLGTGNLTAFGLCELTCTEGIRAPIGGAGNPASDGADAKGTVSLASGLLAGDVGKSGLANGTPGYGASAGGANTNASWSTTDGVVPGTFEGGNGGSGGCPGAGGQGGATGGGSVALLVLAGSVTVQGSVLEAGLGGDGGDGGQGGAGGTGGQGAPPTVDTMSGIEPVPNITWPSTCTISGDPLKDNCAEYGGIGGAGGAGGHGGGGAGGSTFAVVTAGSATCSVDAATTVTLGEPGSGGVGNGGGRAPNGQRLETFHVN